MPDFSELLIEETFCSEIKEISTYYKISEKNGVEFYATTFFDINREIHSYFSDEFPAILSGWMMYLDYTKYSDEDTTPMQLKKFIEDININSYLSPHIYPNSIDENYILELRELFDCILNKYKIYVSYHPYFQQYFSFVYEILHNIHCLIKNPDNYKPYFDLARIAQNELNKNILIAIKKHQEYREYVNQAIIIPIQKSHIRKTSDLIINYESYLNLVGNKSVFAEAIYSYTQEWSWDEIQFYYGDIDTQPRVNGVLTTADGDIDEKTYINDIIEEVGVNNDYYFLKQFGAGIKYLIFKKLVLKKCEFCDRYFLNKFSFSARYCDSPYRKTKTTCQEYVSRNNYKKRTSISPIYAEYNKIYNRIYSRVRRGTMTEVDAKFEQLKEIRNSYMTKYDVADDLQKLKLITTFISEINSLYNKK